MKKLFLFAMLAIGLTSFAQVRDGSPMQDKMEKLTPEQKTERHLKKLTSELNLNSKQQEQIKQLLAAQGAKREEFKAKREEYKNSPVKPSPEERAAFRSKVDEEKKAMDEKMKAILSPEQYEKWNANKIEKKEKIKARMEERRK